jgi:hypothetical protein
MIANPAPVRFAGAKLFMAMVVATSVIGGARAAPGAPPATTSAALPGDSIYQLPVVLTGQDGGRARLDARRCAPFLVSMFYS